MDSTYVQQSAADATYVAPSGGQGNETFQIDAAPTTKSNIQNETMVIDRPAALPVTSRITPSMNSIMTDDISDDEAVAVVATPPKPTHQLIRSAAKNHKELFKWVFYFIFFYV